MKNVIEVYPVHCASNSHVQIFVHPGSGRRNQSDISRDNFFPRRKKIGCQSKSNSRLEYDVTGKETMGRSSSE